MAGFRAMAFEFLKVAGQSDCEKPWFRKSFVTGHDVSRAKEKAGKCRALAPAAFQIAENIKRKG